MNKTIEIPDIVYPDAKPTFFKSDKIDTCPICAKKIWPNQQPKYVAYVTPTGINRCFPGHSKCVKQTLDKPFTYAYITPEGEPQTVELKVNDIGKVRPT